MEAFGIQMVHVTPSGAGLRVVAKMLAGHDDLTKIADWQQWLYRQLTNGEELPLDTCVKDFARLSFVVPLMDFLFLNDDVFTTEAEYKVENNFGEQPENLPPEKKQEPPKPSQPLQLGEINVDVINNHLRYRPYKPSKRHAWWVDFGQYLRFKGIAQEHVAAYITCMKMQLLFNKLVATDDPSTAHRMR